MAEFIVDRPAKIASAPEDGFNAMGKPIPQHRKQNAFEHCKLMGLDTEEAWFAVNGTAEQLARDQPYEAQAIAMKYLDLVGSYRLMAVLLTA